MVLRRVTAAALVSLSGLFLTGCGPTPETVALHTREGVPDGYSGGIRKLLGEHYHAEWLRGGDVLSVSTVFASDCIAIPTAIEREASQVISITLVPHQEAIPCIGGLHAVTYEFSRPPGIEASRATKLDIGNARVTIKAVTPTRNSSG